MTDSHRTLRHEFVEFVPEQLEEGVLYISMRFATAAHLCACGCGNKVVTPFTPTDWKLIFDGDTVSVDPSIGNWAFPCQSHYWISSNEVVWAPRWSRERIIAGKAYDLKHKARYYSERGESSEHGQEEAAAVAGSGLWARIKRRFF